MFRPAILRSRPPLLATCFTAKHPLSHSTRFLLLYKQKVANVRLPHPRSFITSPRSQDAQKPSETSPPASTTGKPPYSGPLTQTFRRLKIFSVASFSLSCTLAPFMFIVESNLPMAARVALASLALGTSGISTLLVGWCGQPYVNSLKYLTPEENAGAEGIQMTTQTLFLKPRITTVYDPTFLIETKRAFAKWELTTSLVLPSDKSKHAVCGTEETVAETTDKDGTVLGRWIVKWDEGGKGDCHLVGTVVRYFNVHEELL